MNHNTVSIQMCSKIFNPLFTPFKKTNKQIITMKIRHYAKTWETIIDQEKKRS